MFLDSSKDSGPAGEDVLLFYWAQSETRAVLFLLSEVLLATIEHLFMVLGQIKTFTF